MLRSPVLHGKIMQFVDKFTLPHPDSINIALDYVLSKLKTAPENYKYYLIHFLNEYAKSNIVGMDACYVHLAKNYYCNGGAPWVKKEELEKKWTRHHSRSWAMRVFSSPLKSGTSGSMEARMILAVTLFGCLAKNSF